MTIKEARNLNNDELNIEIRNALKALFDSRFKHSMNQLENTAQLRFLKHRIAQLKTVLNEKTKQA